MHVLDVDTMSNVSYFLTSEFSFVIVIAGELEESMAELEENRRKLINLKMQKDGVSGMQVPIPVPVPVSVPVPVPNAVNGTMSPEKHSDMSKRLRELKESVEEIKVLFFDFFYHFLHLSSHIFL